ncbi:hypothetical protein F5H01DRAFT_342796 [Linnemannia elongata]|nr:hypothetical protein F5H01DRAFT_342796 [Linnemannia elongata]
MPSLSPFTPSLFVPLFLHPSFLSLSLIFLYLSLLCWWIFLCIPPFSRCLSIYYCAWLCSYFLPFLCLLNFSVGSSFFSCSSKYMQDK